MMHRTHGRSFETHDGQPRLAALALALALGAAACGSGGGGTGGTGSSSASGASGASSSGTTDSCGADAGASIYAVGLAASSKDQKLTVRFVDSNPAPPAKGNNIFTVQLVDGGGAPVDGATITTKSYMPAHGHTSPITPTTKPTGPPGTYEIGPVNLFMPGVWQVTFTVEMTGGTKESVVFAFCAEG